MMSVVKVARALGDPIRYRIMRMIASNKGECCRGLCNCDIQAATGMSQSRVSYHIRELLEAGLVREEVKGRWKFYTVNLEVLQQFVRRLQDDLRQQPDHDRGGLTDEGPADK